MALDQEIIIILRLVLATALGILIGIERQHRKVETRSYGSAGLRTHTMVSLSAALITSVGAMTFPSDPARLAASIMAGVGFLGAGTIIAYQEKIKGLTTAASIWAAATIGIAVGLGAYITAIFATLIILIILELRKIETIG